MTDSMQRREFFRRSAIVAAGVVAGATVASTLSSLPTLDEPTPEPPKTLREMQTGDMWMSGQTLYLRGENENVYIITFGRTSFY